MSKHTRGPCYVGLRRVITDSGTIICEIPGSPANESVMADAELIAEAFNVATETGLTPRQLAEQRAELLAACKKASEWLEGWASASPYIDILDEAIANATAHQSDERASKDAQE